MDPGSRKETTTIRNLVLALGPALSLLAGAESSKTEPRDAQRAGALFTEHVAPAFKKECLGCHGSEKPQSGLDLSTREGLLKGGDKGPAIVVGNPEAGTLVKRLRGEIEPAMPFKGARLPNELIARIAEWITAGAPYSAPLATKAPGPPAKPYWAFQVPKRPAEPAVRNRQWVRNPIDAFLAADHEKQRLTPVAPAAPSMLLRRVYLDLIGLPPTTDETRAFLADKSPDAYEKVVDKLLASPHYGERWGRHWMDVWRYTDPSGFGKRMDRSHQHIWHWRDWIIESLNRDKGYDQMVTLMLAGDEINPTDHDSLRATGYLARIWYRFNRNAWLQDTVDHTMMAFQGVSLKCARCHDHKYDPFKQEEYYRLRAFFEAYDMRADRLPGHADPDKDSLPRVYEAEPREVVGNENGLPAIFPKTYLFIRGDDKDPDTSRVLEPGVPEAFGRVHFDIKPVKLPADSYNPDLRPFVERDVVAQAKADIHKQEAALAETHRLLDELRKKAAVAKTEPSADPFAQARTVFEQDIKPVFEKNCMRCHDAQRATSGLALETIETILQGGIVSGPAVIRGKSRESPLIQHLRGEKKPRMPLSGPAMPADTIARIEKWINTLPEERLEVRLKKTEAAAALGEKSLAAARAALPALQARIDADRAKYSVPPDPGAEALATTARKTEQEANFAKAEENLVRAQQKLAEAKEGPGDEKAKTRRIADARRQLEAAAAVLGKPAEGYTAFAKPFPSTSSGRRTALAHWIASKDNPLTARVAVNHMWMRHFGKALVPLVADFGNLGKPPVNRDLLDWLATEFMDRNWSMKAIHRLMVTSSAYRMRSSAGPAPSPNAAIDGENKYFWRMNARRMEAETVRDSVLYLSGDLDLTIGGKSVEENEVEESRRRGMYFWQTVDAQSEFLKLFDVASPVECYERRESIVPQQALALANSRLSLMESRRLAKKLSARVGNKGEAAFVGEAFETVLGRPPSAADLKRSRQFLVEQAAIFGRREQLTSFGAGAAAEIAPAESPEARARENLVHVLFNHNDFVTIR